MNTFFDPEKVRLGVDNNRLSSLLCAILDAVGEVTLTKEQAERVWEGRELHFREDPDGGITLSLKPIREKEV
jgi:hypothetical protein